MKEALLTHALTPFQASVAMLLVAWLPLLLFIGRDKFRKWVGYTPDRFDIWIRRVLFSCGWFIGVTQSGAALYFLVAGI